VLGPALELAIPGGPLVIEPIALEAELRCNGEIDPLGAHKPQNGADCGLEVGAEVLVEEVQGPDSGSPEGRVPRFFVGADFVHEIVDLLEVELDGTALRRESPAYQTSDWIARAHDTASAIRSRREART
jgi:hypothetical protein